MTESSAADWSAFHLHYHGDRGLLLRQVVRPLVVRWLDEGVIDRFFFVLYLLGGPHVRLRLRLSRTDVEDRIAERIRAAAESFFRTHPTSTPISEGELKEQTRRLLETDPSEGDPTLYPDAFVREVPFRPETDRYGGPRHLGASLDFFMASSAAALDFWHRHGHLPSGRRFPQILRMLIAQAKGLAETPGQTRKLLSYGIQGRVEAMAAVVRRGDEQYEQKGKVFRQLVQVTPAILSAPELDLLHQAAGALRRETRAAPPPARRLILRSQMHMTANRLGLNNPEEAYLSRILERAGQDLEDADVAPAAESQTDSPEAWLERVRHFLAG